MKLSEHFEREEFEKESPMPETSVQAYRFLALNILEPIRAQFGEPLEVTSGDRRSAANQACHGDQHSEHVSNRPVSSAIVRGRDMLAVMMACHGDQYSEHVSTADYCAADWTIRKFQQDMRPVFDWIRLHSLLPFHNVVLEHGKNGDVIHVSWSRFTNMRVAKE